MRNNYFHYVSILALSIIGAIFLKIPIEEEKGLGLISSMLTVFSIFFGFYMTSFAVFATSKYMSKLYKKQDIKNNSKTLLHNLLDKFKYATYCLLLSIIYLIVLYILVIFKSSSATHLTHIFWFVLFINLYFIFHTIWYFIKVTMQSAIEEDD